MWKKIIFGSMQNNKTFSTVAERMRGQKVDRPRDLQPTLKFIAHQMCNKHRKDTRTGLVANSGAGEKTFSGVMQA